jgi:hypothetical protein
LRLYWICYFVHKFLNTYGILGHFKHGPWSVVTSLLTPNAHETNDIVKQNQDPLYGAFNLLKEPKYALITNATTLVVRQDQWRTSIACWHAKFVIIWANVAKITSIHPGWCFKTSKSFFLKEKNICNVLTTNEWNHVKFCLIHFPHSWAYHLMQSL